MRKKLNTTKHTLHFFAGDVARLQELYPEPGASAVIRALVRKHIEAIEAKADKVADVQTEIEL